MESGPKTYGVAKRLSPRSVDTARQWRRSTQQRRRRALWQVDAECTARDGETATIVGLWLTEEARRNAPPHSSVVPLCASLLAQTVDQLILVWEFAGFVLGVHQVTVDHHIENATGAFNKKRVGTKRVL